MTVKVDVQVFFAFQSLLTPYDNFILLVHILNTCFKSWSSFILMFIFIFFVLYGRDADKKWSQILYHHTLPFAIRFNWKSFTLKRARFYLIVTLCTIRYFELLGCCRTSHSRYLYPFMIESRSLFCYLTKHTNSYTILNKRIKVNITKNDKEQDCWSTVLDVTHNLWPVREHFYKYIYICWIWADDDVKKEARNWKI